MKTAMPANFRTLDDLHVPDCHWAHIDGDRHRAASASAVWICEHPYPSMRVNGPSEDCAGCPVWDAMVRSRQAARDRHQAEAGLLLAVRR
jgi:hypothetical protein